MIEPSAVVITGASGFLGEALIDSVSAMWPGALIYSVASPSAEGIDLASPTATDELEAQLAVANPGEAILIHAAAAVKWDEPAGLIDNANMALNVAAWAESIGIGFSVLVSGVNVYPALPTADVDTPCAPPTLYGLGKWTAEQVWRLRLPEGRRAAVRLAGLWGWQRRPTLFWNRLLTAAAQKSDDQASLVVGRSHSKRNYISVGDAANCLLRVAENRMDGLFLAAGRDVVETGRFVEAVQGLPGSRLQVDWRDDGISDQLVFEPSPELKPWLTSFSDELPRIWSTIPAWVTP